jgi:hypothetical protein
MRLPRLAVLACSPGVALAGADRAVIENGTTTGTITPAANPRIASFASGPFTARRDVREGHRDLHIVLDAQHGGVPGEPHRYTLGNNFLPG